MAYCICVFVDHALNEVYEIWQQISRRGVFRRRINLIAGALLYVTIQNGEL